jgi:hypothetical protein
MVERATGISRSTIVRGIRERRVAPVDLDRTRKMGGGRKKATDKDETLVADLSRSVAFSDTRSVRLWKWELQRFARRTGLSITVCHFPPGTSKWNKIEHRLFSYIAMNWRGKPLELHHPPGACVIN